MKEGRRKRREIPDNARDIEGQRNDRTKDKGRQKTE